MVDPLCENDLWARQVLGDRGPHHQHWPATGPSVICTLPLEVLLWFRIRVLIRACGRSTRRRMSQTSFECGQRQGLHAHAEE